MNQNESFVVSFLLTANLSATTINMYLYRQPQRLQVSFLCQRGSIYSRSIVGIDLDALTTFQIIVDYMHIIDGDDQAHAFQESAVTSFSDMMERYWDGRGRRVCFFKYHYP